MRVEKTGSGPVLLLVHGALSDARSWEGQRALASDFTLLIASLSGYRPDAAVTDDTSAQSQSDELLDLVRAIDGPVALAGHSRGGRIALDVARRAGAKISHLVLIEPGGVAEADFYAGVRREPPKPSPHGDVRSLARRLVAEGRAEDAMRTYVDDGHGAGCFDTLPRFYRDMMAQNVHTLDMMIRDASVPLSRAAAAQVCAPAMLILGRRSPSVFHETTAALRACMAGLDVLDIDSDHFMPVREPAAVNAALRARLTGARA